MQNERPEVYHGKPHTERAQRLCAMLSDALIAATNAGEVSAARMAATTACQGGVKEFGEGHLQRVLEEVG